MFTRQVYGFTYIELLVVIAIVAILTSIILPVLVQAKERGCQTSCAAKVRQVAVAVMQYTDDHGEIMLTETKDSSWALQLATYNEPGVYDCPTHPGIASNTKPEYGYNAALFDAGIGGIDSPASTILVADLCVGSASPNFAIIDPDRDIDTRHNDGAMVAFVDGHVARIKLTGQEVYQRLMALGYSFTPKGTPLPWKVVATGRGTRIDVTGNGSDGYYVMNGGDQLPPVQPKYATDWDITALEARSQSSGNEGWCNVGTDDDCSAQLIFGESLSISGAAWTKQEGVNEYSISLTLPDTDRSAHQVTFWTPWYHPNVAPRDVDFTVKGANGQSVSYTLNNLLPTRGGYATLSFVGSVTISVSTTPPPNESSAMTFGALLFD